MLGIPDRNGMSKEDGDSKTKNPKRYKYQERLLHYQYYTTSSKRRRSVRIYAKKSGLAQSGQLERLPPRDPIVRLLKFSGGCVDVWLPWLTQTNTDETGKLQELIPQTLEKKMSGLNEIV